MQERLAKSIQRDTRLREKGGTCIILRFHASMKYTAYGNLVFRRLQISELSASEFLIVLFYDFTLEL